MLVLTRKQGEMIRIGDGIVIKVISSGRGKAKIGIEAPGDVRVLRGELAEALAAMKEEEAPSVANELIKN
ncbi:MAG: carbon storage regulator [Planctomycetaceae bacterium]|nr:carbon storage regulator [Planctomycetaceae bacterium]MCB9949958.1 carbon storage regulator [Planctomycetaceae bacterium]